MIIRGEISESGWGLREETGKLGGKWEEKQVN